MKLKNQRRGDEAARLQSTWRLNSAQGGGGRDQEEARMEAPKRGDGETVNAQPHCTD